SASGRRRRTWSGGAGRRAHRCCGWCAGRVGRARRSWPSRCAASCSGPRSAGWPVSSGCRRWCGGGGAGGPRPGPAGGPAARGQGAAMEAALRALPMLDVPGVLLVVDYAEGDPELVSALLREAVSLTWPRSAARAVPVRILLLARDEPDWWRNVTDLAEPGWVAPRPLRLRPLPPALATSRRAPHPPPPPP